MINRGGSQVLVTESAVYIVRSSVHIHVVGFCFDAESSL